MQIGTRQKNLAKKLICLKVCIQKYLLTQITSSLLRLTKLVPLTICHRLGLFFSERRGMSTAVGIQPQDDSEHRSSIENANFLAGSRRTAQVQTADSLIDVMLCLIQ